MEGPWVDCPRCRAPVLLSLFAESDDEPGVQVAACRGCATLVTLQPPRHPLGDAG